MSDSFIGWWAHRKGGKWHLVESEVTNRVVMRCGRQMALETKGGFLRFEDHPIAGEPCEQCAGKIVADG